MRDIVPELEKHGAKLVAVSPLKQEHIQGLVEKHKLNFDLVSDPGNEYMAQLGLRFTVPPDLNEVYKSLGIDLEASNGDSSATLPVPARLVIDSSGTVRAADIDVDYTRRPEAEKTLEDVKALG